MGNEAGNNNNLYMPPKLEETFTMNTAAQQDTMAQPQDLLMGQPQNLLMGQPQQDLLMGQPKQIEEQQAPEEKPFNITDFLQEKGWKAPTIEEQIATKKAEIKEAKKEKIVVQKQVTTEKTEEEEEAELEEAERIKYLAKQAHMASEEYLQAQKLQQQQEQEQKTEQVQQAGKVKFEEGVNSKPGGCEKLSRKRKVSTAKKRMGGDVVGLTHHTGKLLDQFDTGRTKAIADSEVAMREMRPINEKRVALEKEQREKLLQKQKEQEAKRKSGKARNTGDFPREEKIKPIDEGFNEAEGMLVELASLVPISKTSTILSDNPATRAMGLKALVDRAVCYDISANMICSVALTKNLSELRQMVLHVPMIRKLLDSNPDAIPFLDKQKMKMFENVEKMIPDLKTGMEQGLRLNGLDLMGGSYYENQPNIDVEADKKDAMYQWAQASSNLQALDSTRRQDLDLYAEYTNESWDKHEAYQQQTKTITINRFEVDASGIILVSGMNDYKESHASTIEMVQKSQGLASGKASYLEMIAGTAPINATQEQMNAHVESFKPENAEATVKGLVHDFLRMPFAEKLPVAESAQDTKKLSELMQLKDKLTALSALPEYFKDVFADKEFETQKAAKRAAKKAGAKQPAGEKEPELKDKNRKLRHLLGSAQQVAKSIDTQIEFLIQLHNARPDQINPNEQLKYGAGVKASQDIYKTFIDSLTKEEGAAKLRGW